MEGNPGAPIQQGTQLSLPLWLAEMLAVSQTPGAPPMTTLDLPTCLAPRVQNALIADPKSVDVRAQASHFYGLAARMLDLFEEDELTELLLRTLRGRAVGVADHAGSPRGATGDGVGFLRGLDELERQCELSAL